MTTREILNAIGKLRVLVAGDVCLDRWCRYSPNKYADVSRETGIPRIAVVSTGTTPGAAGTVASNVAALGARVDVLGVVGDDGFGWELDRALERHGIGHDMLVRAPGVQTFTYTKLINESTGCEDLPRVDFIHPELPCDVADRLEQAAQQYDVVLVSDQAETAAGGVVTPRMREVLAQIRGPLVWVDSRLRAELFRGVVVKPNYVEAEAACLRGLGRVDFEALRRHMQAPLLVITRGAGGALVVDARGMVPVPTRPVERPVDICGAGDSFSAGAALALRVTGDPLAAVRFGNLVASITIMKPGTGTASPEELLAAC
jgi:rfaE bifunctional protein kinase chain/domain